MTADDIYTEIRQMHATPENLRTIIGAAEQMAHEMRNSGIGPIHDHLLDAWSLCDYLDPPIDAAELARDRADSREIAVYKEERRA